MIEIKSLKSDLEFIEHNPSKVLELSVGSVKVTTPGTLVPKADASTAPNLALSGLSQSQTYIAICVDLDAPYACFSFLGPILHWIQADLRLSTSEPSASTLTTATPPMVSWEPAAPPPLSAPHRYVVLLYEQPEEFDAAKCTPKGGKDMALTDRIRFDYAKWVEGAGLEKLVGANFFNSN